MFFHIYIYIYIYIYDPLSISKSSIYYVIFYFHGYNPLSISKSSIYYAVLIFMAIIHYLSYKWPRLWNSYRKKWVSWGSLVTQMIHKSSICYLVLIMYVYIYIYIYMYEMHYPFLFMTDFFLFGVRTRRHFATFTIFFYISSDFASHTAGLVHTYILILILCYLSLCWSVHFVILALSASNLTI